MARYLTLAKYTDSALTGVRAGGYATRPEQLGAFIESLGGSLISMDYTTDDRYDFAAVIELPSSEALFAMISFAKASGTVADSMTLELTSPAEADAAVAASTIEYVAPGAGG